VLGPPWGIGKRRIWADAHTRFLHRVDKHTNLMTPPTIAATIDVVPVRGSRAKEEVT